MNFLIDTDNLKYIEHGVVRVNRIDMKPSAGYSEIDYIGIKPVGRIYYDQYKNLNYATGEPVEKPIISGGEQGAANVRKWATAASYRLGIRRPWEWRK